MFLLSFYRLLTEHTSRLFPGRKYFIFMLYAGPDQGRIQDFF